MRMSKQASQPDMIESEKASHYFATGGRNSAVIEHNSQLLSNEY